MLRLLSYNHLFTYVVLFLVTVAVRLPSFHPNYFEQDESFYLTCAEKVVDGGVQYVDTWDNKPPVLVWFYSFFVWLFGSGAIIAIRSFTVIYLFISAMLLNQFVVDNKLIERFSLVPGFLLVFFSSVPWYAQELNGELLINLPVMIAVFQILNLGERNDKNNNYLFLSGLLLGLCFMIKYQSIFLFFGLLAGYLTIQPPKLSEIFSMLAGFFLSIMVLVGVVYLTGAIKAYWDIGLLYNLDYIAVGSNLGEEISVLFNLGQYLKLFGPILLIALIAAAHYRLNYFTNSIRLRKVEVFLLYWFGAALLTVVVGGGRLYLHYFLLMVPPIAIYAAKFFEMRMNPWLRQLAFIGAMAIPMYTFGVFLVSAFPKTFEMVDPYTTEGGWIADFRTRLNEPHPLEQFIDKSKVKNGILVMDYEPSIYARLGLPCATRYTNFSLAYYKLEAFRARSGKGLISRTETLAETYRAFRDQLPEYIIDPLNLFPDLRDKMPIVFAQYNARLVTVGSRSYRIYYR
jgi:4-amino-4-deoxy-L-arabinose transferase-like glycosyltransferase